MKKNFFPLFLAICTFSCLLTSCKKNQNANAFPLVKLDSITVRTFANQFVNAVISEDSATIVSLFDLNNVKDSLKNNPLINSSFNADFGEDFFNDYFSDLQKVFVNAINQGGDFMFIKYYFKDHKHHFLTRVYNDFTLRIDDWIVDTVNNSLKITDAFFFNLSSSLINAANYSLQYRILEYTDPKGVTSAMTNAKALLMAGQEKKSIQILKENQNELQIYPFFWQLYIRALYDADYLHFIENFDKIIAPHFDERSILLHKLIFYANNAMIEETEFCINQLIDCTADDPIYLFFYATALMNAKEYDKALICFQNLDEVMPVLWDIWCGKLECFYYLNDKINFKNTAIQAEKLYNMPNDELMQFIDNHFPAMKNLDYFEKNS